MKSAADKLFDKANRDLNTFGFVCWLSGVYGTMCSRITAEDLAAMQDDLARMTAKSIYNKEGGNP